MKKLLRRFQKKDFAYHRKWYAGFPVGETIIFLTILVCTLIEVALVL